MKNSFMNKICVLIIFIIIGKGILAQPPTELPSKFESPYQAVYNHLFYLQPDSFNPEQAARSIHGVEDVEERKKLAVRLKQVLDGKGLKVNLKILPRDNNYRDSSNLKMKYVLFPDYLPEVSVEKIKDGWYYSTGTVSLIEMLHKETYPLGSDWLMNLMPRFGHSKVAGLFVWQVVGFGILFLLAFILYLILLKVFQGFIRRVSATRLGTEYLRPKLILKIARYGSMLFAMYFFRIFLPVLHLNIHISEWANKAITIFSAVLFILLALRLVDFVLLYFEKFAKSTASTMDDQLVPIVRRLLDVLIVIWGVIYILNTLNVNVTALIAGVSIGGLALALAAQDTVKNLIGSLMIFVDRPFQIGDSVTFSGGTGTVEEVGFRSTRIRTIENSLIAVPNGKLVNEVIDNKGLRKYRLFRAQLALKMETPPARIDQFIAGVRKILEEYPNTNKDILEVHLNGIDQSALQVLLMTYLDVPGWGQEMAAKHELYILILKLAKEVEVEFAVPVFPNANNQ